MGKGERGEKRQGGREEVSSALYSDASSSCRHSNSGIPESGIWQPANAERWIERCRGKLSHLFLSSSSSSSSFISYWSLRFVSILFNFVFNRNWISLHLIWCVSCFSFLIWRKWWNKSFVYLFIYLFFCSELLACGLASGSSLSSPICQCQPFKFRPKRLHIWSYLFILWPPSVCFPALPPSSLFLLLLNNSSNNGNITELKLNPSPPLPPSFPPSLPASLPPSLHYCYHGWIHGNIHALPFALR